MHSRISRIVSALFLALLMASTLIAQTAETGSIQGKVSDKNGPLPGVTVEVTSVNLQGTRTATTDSKGEFRVNLLPPGKYQVNSSLSGFSAVKQNNVAVGLSRTVSLEIIMSPALSEQITVSAAAPIVDVTSASTGTNVTAETMQSLPLARNYTAAVQIAPGAGTDNSGATFYGSSGAENQYVIDGLNTTAVRSGIQGKELNVDFVQELDVKTGALPAEYGRLTGGMVDAITKSGGNEFKGDVAGFDAPSSFRANNTSFTQRSGTTPSVTETGTQIRDFDGDLGGYFMKDRLWFFGAFDRASSTDLATRILTPLEIPGSATIPVGATFPGKNTQSLYAGKLTLRLNDSNNFNVSVFGDPRTNNGPQFIIAGPPSTYQGTLKTGSADYIGHYEGVFGSSFVVTGQAGRHSEKTNTSGPGASIPNISDRTGAQPVNSGGFGFFEDDTFNRKTARLDVGKYWANHDFKVGVDYENLNANVNEFDGGAGERIQKKLSSTGTVFYTHRYFINDQAPGFDRANPATWQLAVPLTSTPQTKNTAAYIQDAWRLAPQFTLSAGFRWEKQQVIGRGGVTAFELNKNYSPRIGFIWDVENNGRSKAYANFGRFFEAIPMDINIRSFGGELSCICANFSPDPANFLQDPAATLPISQGGTVGVRPSLLGGSTEPVDPNLKGQHIDEYVAGYEHEMGSNLVVGVKGTYRKLANVIEDMLIGGTGSYLIANPGSGIGREAGFYDGGSVVTPTAKRNYKGVELNARKRFSNNTQFIASYLWSRLEGNYDGVFQASTGQLDPNINSAFDYADFIVNNNGLLSNDRTHTLKFDGSYQFSSGMLNGLQMGLTTYWQSGTPLTAVGYSSAYQNWEYYLTPRGALGRGPSDYEASAHFGFPINMGSTRVMLIADVFNLLNRQGKTVLDQRFNRINDAPCTGIGGSDVCTSDGGLRTVTGTITPVGGISTANAPNPDFLKAGTQFDAPRSFRIGARVTF
jgi:outer membrane receptor protein involved in Fe transport